MAYPKETIEEARTLWLMGATAQEIQTTLSLNNRRIVYTWAERYQWDKVITTESLIVKTARRINCLIEQPQKKDTDYKELDNLSRTLVQLEKADAFKRGEVDLAPARGRKPKQKNGERKSRKKKIKNDVSGITPESLQAIEDTLLYPHQKIWIKAGEDPKTYRNRFILKSRQIGATFTFAWEAFKTAVLKGHNQIFISSTKAQAEVFKAYIFVIAKEQFDIELAGNPTILSNHAEIHYLSPNSYANSRSGDVYFDEVFYTRSFDKMEAVAKPMATLQEFKQTYFGAPTALSHPAYKIWSGERYTQHHKDGVIKVSDHKALMHGRLDVDGFWRCVCSLYDAIELGWDRVNLEQLRLETPSPERFENIYGCRFVDDAESVFKLSDLLACGVDPIAWFPEYERENVERPAGDLPVAVGYDPARDGDNAAVSVLSIPQYYNDKFRLFETDRLTGMPATSQAYRVSNKCERFNVEYIGIDKTGPGLFMPDLVLDALEQAEIDPPRIHAMQYSAELKSFLVQKAVTVIAQRRFEYDAADPDIALAFMTIRQASTNNGTITYYSTRTEATGHGDTAWSIMQAMAVESSRPSRQGRGRGGAYFD